MKRPLPSGRVSADWHMKAGVVSSRASPEPEQAPENESHCCDRLLSDFPPQRIATRLTPLLNPENVEEVESSSFSYIFPT